MTTQYAMTAIYNGTTRIYWVVTGAPDTTGTQSGYPTGLLTSIVTDYTTSSSVTSSGNTVYANVWQTALELDFTAQTTQSISSDGSYTIGGYSFTKINSADDRVAMAVTNGTGLVVQPGTAGANGGDYINNIRTLPALTMALSTYVPNFTLDTPIRVWLYNSADNAAANYDACVLAFERPNGNTNYAAKKGYSGALSLNCTANFNASNQGQTNSTGVYTNNVFVLECLDGLSSLRSRFFSGTFGNGFPGFSTLKQVATVGPSTGAFDSQFTGQPSDWNLLIGAQRAGSSTSTYSTTIARIRIEYIAINSYSTSNSNFQLISSAYTVQTTDADIFL